ncbi:uncharacterized protein G2W53_026934 [Senna tora]|uniref:Uncharacterized protein n=1 Tax=Senna tora TaxID=362788 RepID=A0A834WLT9_9FABA|nr:uncharacterized protein G2W53_026934 [Senna tora]
MYVRLPLVTSTPSSSQNRRVLPCFANSIKLLACGSCTSPSFILATKGKLGLVMAASSAFLLNASTTKLAFPGLYSITKSNSARKSCHLACFGVRFF